MWTFPAAIALMAMQAAGAATTSAPSAPPEAPQEIDFRTDPVLRFTVPVRIGGEIRQFLVDTGAERSGISLELAHSLGLPTGDKSQVTGFAGKAWVPTVPVSMPGFGRGPDKELSALGFSADAIGADGFLGLDTLRGHVVLFDFIQQRMIIRGSVETPTPFDTPADAIARLRMQNSRLVFTSARANGVEVQAVLDTGSSLSVGNEALRSELIRRHKLGLSYPIKILAVTGEVIPADYYILKDLWVGRVRIQNMRIAFAGPEPFATLGFTQKPALLLGMDALRSFARVEIDFPNNEVHFTAKPSGGAYVIIDS